MKTVSQLVEPCQSEKNMQYAHSFLILTAFDDKTRFESILDATHTDAIVITSDVVLRL